MRQVAAATFELIQVMLHQLERTRHANSSTCRCTCNDVTRAESCFEVRFTRGPAVSGKGQVFALLNPHQPARCVGLSDTLLGTEALLAFRSRLMGQQITRALHAGRSVKGQLSHSLLCRVGGLRCSVFGRHRVTQQAFSTMASKTGARPEERFTLFKSLPTEIQETILQMFARCTKVPCCSWCTSLRKAHPSALGVEGTKRNQVLVL